MVFSSPPHPELLPDSEPGSDSAGVSLISLTPRRSTCCVSPENTRLGCCINARGINSEAYCPSNLFRSSTRTAQVIACQRQTPLLPRSPQAATLLPSAVALPLGQTPPSQYRRNGFAWENLPRPCAYLRCLPAACRPSKLALPRLPSARGCCKRCGCCTASATRAFPFPDSFLYQSIQHQSTPLA